MKSELEHSAAGLWHHTRWQIYRNAQPALEASIDAAALEGDFAFTLLSYLFSGQPFQLAIKPSFEEGQRLQEAYFECRVQERISGAHPFGLGFPLFVGLDQAGEPIAAPLFIWNLTIEPGAKPGDGWTISRRPFQHAAYNHFLAHYWRNELGLEIEAELAAAIEKGLPSAAALAAICDQANEALDIPPGGGQIAIAKQPAAEEIRLGPLKGRIAWAGALGVFPPHTHLFATAGELPDEAAPAFAGHPFGLLPLSPEQASVAELARQHPLLLVTGPAGSGKTHLAAHLLTNALSNNQKCLLVSSRAGVLRQMQRQLELMGIGRLSFLLRDVNLDLALFLEILRSMALAKETGEELKPVEFPILTARLERLKEKLDSSYYASRKMAFGNTNWAAAVGKYLKSARKEGKESLATQLNAQEYQFNDAAYQEMAEAIDSCQRLFDKSSTLYSPLNKLHQGVFLRMQKAEAREFVEEKIEALLSRSTLLQQWYANRIDAYASLLSAHYEQYFQDYARRISQLQDQLAEYRGRFGDDFLHQGQGALRFKKLFSAKARALTEARQGFAVAYERLGHDFSINAYFDFQFDAAANGAAIAQAKACLERFEQGLQIWHAQQQDLVQEEIARLSPKTTLPILNFETQAAELENGLEGLLEQVNESGLYHLPIHNKMLTLPKQQRLLDSLIEQFETSRRALPEFDDFYDWQHNWLQLSEQARRLVKALIKLRPKDWKAAFDSWFLDNCLSRSYESALPPEKDSLQQMAMAHAQLEELMPSQILYNWQSRKEEAVRKLRRSSNEAAQWLAGKAVGEERSSWMPLFEKGTESIATIMPALLVTPHLADELFANAGKVFDYILVDEAQSLQPAEAAFLRGLAQRAVFFAAAPVLEGAAEPEILGLIEAMGGRRFTLHQSQQAFPLDLLQSERFSTLPDAKLSPVAFEQVGGLYDEQKETNEDEALYIISLLNRIEQTPQRTYPTVGIACFTKGQRRLIASYLLNIKQRRSTGVEIIQQLERNGLAVLELDELAGQRFDILIISSTYGAADIKGRLTNHLQRINRQLPQLLLMMSRTEKRVMLVNSIPLERLQELLGRPEDKPAYLLAAYFLAARAASQGDGAFLSRLQENLPPWAKRPWPYPQPLDFLEEVGIQLRPYLAPGRIKFETAGEAELGALKILPPADAPGQALYVAVEGFLAQTPYTDYRWEYAQHNMLAAQGFFPLSARPADWWRDPERQAKRLASTIIIQEQKLAKEEEE